MKSKHWILIFILLLMLSLAAILLIPQRKANRQIAQVYQDGVLIETIDLTTLIEPKELHLTNHGKENVILAEPGQISMQSANCPDQLCVHQGVISNSAYPIVCLPNKVVIELTAPSADMDTLTR